ncbi:MAG: hypothetical protein AB7J40_01935 [Candidatus Altimarinota bacterium]
MFLKWQHVLHFREDHIVIQRVLRKESVSFIHTPRGESVIHSRVRHVFFMAAMMSIGCSNLPWSEEQQPSTPMETPTVEMKVPAEDREAVEELLRQRAAQRGQTAEAANRRHAALNELQQAREALRQWQENISDPRRDEMIRGWQLRIAQLEDEIRQLNLTLGRDREEGLQPPTPPIPPAPTPTPQTPTAPPG